MVPILALGLWQTILYSTSMPCLTMLGKLSYNIFGCIFTATVLLVIVPFSFFTWGLVGAVWVISFSDLPVYLCNLFGLWKEDLFTLRQDLETTALFVTTTVVLYWVRVAFGIPWSHPVLLR
jgi:hypothetical protein